MNRARVLALLFLCAVLLIFAPLFTITAINTLANKNVITPGADTWSAVFWLQLMIGTYFSMAAKGK